MRESSEFFVQAITVTKNAFTSTAGALCAAGEQGWGALQFALCCWPEAGVWAARLKPFLTGFAQGNRGWTKLMNNWICSDFSCHLCQFKKSEPGNEPQPSAFSSCCISLKGLRWKAVGLLACFLIKLFLLSGTILLFYFFFPTQGQMRYLNVDVPLEGSTRCDLQSVLLTFCSIHGWVLLHPPHLGHSHPAAVGHL